METTEKIMQEEKRERVVLVGLQAGRLKPEDNADEWSMEELAALAETAGAEPVAQVLQKKDAPDPRTFIGEGKVAEVQELIANLGGEMVIFDNDLSPSQMRVLTDEFGVQVLDRSGLILDIFAKRAKTKEGRLQVELAQYQYLLPRLTGMWTHLSGRRLPAAKALSAPAAPAKHSWKQTAAISIGRSINCAQIWKRCAGCAGLSVSSARRMKSRWWPLWATPMRASPRCSMR